jgi:hypothetical protein
LHCGARHLSNQPLSSIAHSFDQPFINQSLNVEAPCIRAKIFQPVIQPLLPHRFLSLFTPFSHKKLSYP